MRAHMDTNCIATQLHTLARIPVFANAHTTSAIECHSRKRSKDNRTARTHTRVTTDMQPDENRKPLQGNYAQHEKGRLGTLIEGAPTVASTDIQHWATHGIAKHAHHCKYII